MNLSKWVQHWLGTSQLDNLRSDIDALIEEANAARTEIAIHNRALARLIAKLDPIYGTSELDPERVAASRKLEQEILQKIYTEHKASNPYGN